MALPTTQDELFTLLRNTGAREDIDEARKTKVQQAFVDDFKTRVGEIDLSQQVEAPAPPPEKKSALANLGQDIRETGAGILEASEAGAAKIRETVRATQAGEQTILEGIFQNLGTAASTGARVVGETVIGAAKAVAPEAVEKIPGQVISGLGEFGAAFIAGLTRPGEGLEGREKVKQAAAQQFSELSQSVEEFKQTNPRAAKNIGALLGVGEAALIASGFSPAKKVVKEAARQAGEATAGARGAVGETAGKIATATEKRLAKQQLEEAVQITKPKLTPTTEAAAKEAGAGEVSRFAGEVSLKPSPREVAVAESVTGIVKKGKSFDKNIQAVENVIKKESTDVEFRLKSNTTSFKPAEIEPFVGKAKSESGIVFGTDKQVEKVYDSVFDEFKKQLAKQEKLASGAGRELNLNDVWQARIGLDKNVQKRFPNIWKAGGAETPVRVGYDDVRSAINEFVAFKDSTFAPSMSKLTNMLAAKKNIALTAPKVGSTTIQRALFAIRDNSTKGLITAFLAGGAVFAPAQILSIISNPIAIAAIVGGGSIFVGKKVVTSKILKEWIIKATRAIEKAGGSSADINALKAISASLGE